MTQEITQDTIKALDAIQLRSVAGWAQDERKDRAERHKQETLAKIREPARSIEVGIKIDGVRGRPARMFQFNGDQDYATLNKTSVLAAYDN